MSCPDTYLDIISLRSFISKQFPTLLAIREIIADALYLPSKIPLAAYSKALWNCLVADCVPVVKCKDTQKNEKKMAF